MKAKEYLDLSQKPEIRVIGLRGKTQIVERPPLKKLKAVCQDREEGVAKFKDSCTFRITKKMTIHGMGLWYGGKEVGYREFPDTNLLPGDALTCTFILEISATGKAFAVLS